MIAPKYSKRIKKCEFCIFHLLHDSTDWAPSSSENPSDNSHAPSWSCASWVPRLFVSECSLLSWLQLGAGLSPPNPKRRLVIPKLSFHHYVRTKSDKNMFLVYGLKSNRAGELRFWEWGCKMWHRMSPKSHVSSCRPRNLSFSGQDRQLMVCVCEYEYMWVSCETQFTCRAKVWSLPPLFPCLITTPPMAPRAQQPQK